MSRASRLAGLQRDWVNRWPRHWPEMSYPARLGWQAGVNAALGSQAVHSSEVPTHSPYPSATADHESWATSRHAGEVFAQQRLGGDAGTTPAPLGCAS